MLPDRLTAIASAAYNAGARPELHNLGGLHADAHRAALDFNPYAPERLPAEVWSDLLTAHRS